MKRCEVDRTKLSPMMRHYVELKDKYEDTIIFYRLGDFYEMFFEDALLVSHELELTLTGKQAGLDERVPMCGIPYHASEIYIDKLIKKGYKVAICEQLEDPKMAKGMVKRDVTEIISSGTIISSNSLNEKENNFIGSIVDFKYCYVLTYTDITTGELYCEILDHNNSKVINKIIFLGIKEVILDSNVDKEIYHKLRDNYRITTSLIDDIYEGNDYDRVIKNVTDTRYIHGFKHLLNYLVVNQKRNMDHLEEIVIKKNDDYLKMDIHTKRNLELTESMRNKERMYSLLWLLDDTKTAMGSRKLKSWIEFPLINKEQIEKRYDVVSILNQEFILCEELRKYLYEVYDLERLCGRIALKTANARDLLQLKKSLEVLPKINDILKSINYKELPDVSSLYQLLVDSIYESPPVGLKEGYLIKNGFNKELDELKDLRSGGKDFISNFEIQERERTGIKNLKVGFNKVFGYYIEISKGSLQFVTEDMQYERKQTLANCERFINPLLKEKEKIILSSEEKIINLEYELFISIRDKCLEYIRDIQEIAKIISEIDVLSTFSIICSKYNYVRPIINDDNVVNIIESRHPVVEAFIKEEYVPNDIVMDENTNILLITGPNMAGKSTYMRQLGIIVIMAQIGCFIPAKSGTLPIFDKIFTRIGASDDLVSGESTFMVEMTEAGNAITNATRKSLILFDELGRGTATFDGMSLAQAILEYIHNNISCKTLFSTHYHELTDLEKTLPNLKNKHVSAKEENGNITFLHKVLDGSVDKSYGINVARLANLPNEVIDRADEILKVYEKKENDRDIVIQTTLPLSFKKENNEIENYIKELNILELTPIDAINILNDLKMKVKDNER
ncbi:dNA mismatch repair protein MutS [Clostridium sp. CAG:914]|jgi:DNA mismatch repair protein MutS|nr:dNA mismatch repair protein MutS [Clostridium sp. CAG:914]